jgi:integration host factor subunit beta
MNKSELIGVLANESELSPAKAHEIVNKIFDTMSDALVAGDRIEIRGFGVFTVRNYETYVGRNPKTGKITDVGPKNLPFFRVGKELAQGVNLRPELSDKVASAEGAASDEESLDV